MLKSRGRDNRVTQVAAASSHTSQLMGRPPGGVGSRTPVLGHKTLPAPTRPEPDYEVVEFPTDQYVNAKLQPPPPPPPRPTVGHPVEAGASCGLCGGGGARVRCAECGRRALCASCDDMYHRHPKRRHHQRQALSASQIRDDRPPLPPKAAAPVPPPRRHKISGERLSASPRPPISDHRRATLGHLSGVAGHPSQTSNPSLNSHLAAQHALHQRPVHLQAKSPAHIGSMPYLPTARLLAPAAAPVAHPHLPSNTLGHLNNAWAQPRGSLQGYNMSPSPNMAAPNEVWSNGENFPPTGHGWSRPLRRGASVLELGGGAGACAGCAHCAPGWRYGSCASLDHAWPQGWPQPACCTPHPMHPHAHQHPPHTPQPYRRVDSRAVSRAASRAGSRAASPAVSVRSRTSRRTKHRTPSPPPLPSSDADSESESETEHVPTNIYQNNEDEESLGPPPPPPTTSWQCEHCTFVNEPGVRVCAVCCRTPTVTPAVVAIKLNTNMERLKITENVATPPSRTLENQRSNTSCQRSTVRQKKERSSIACGPSPPREEKASRKPTSRLVTPTREQSATDFAETDRNHHDMAVGPSPPREVLQNKIDVSPTREQSKTMKVSPYRETKAANLGTANRHSVSVGPSPPREISTTHVSVATTTNSSTQKKSTGTSPPRETTIVSSSSSVSTKARVSNTGTSPPPQNISTQTYEVPSSWERAPSASQSRSRRRFRDEARRERSHSRHSLSSDTRESERSARTSGAGGRWEWRERDSSPGGEGGEGSEGYSRLSRRASHLDLRRTRPNRRASFYGSEAASPEPLSTSRAVSLEALAGVGARREAERGLELARLMSEAERLGFSAAEVQAALAQSPAAPLAWLRARWPSLVAGVRAAAVRLAPNANISEMDARAALARHRGAMWPAVTDCAEKHRLRTESMNLGEERRLRGHVWGPPAGADDEAVPPETFSHRSHRTREESSDEFEAFSSTKLQDDQWMYLPLDMDQNNMFEAQPEFEIWDVPVTNELVQNNTDVEVQHLKQLLIQAESTSMNNEFNKKKLSSDNPPVKNEEIITPNIKLPSLDLVQSENDFIDAYNALTKTSPLPNISDISNQNQQPVETDLNANQENQPFNENDIFNEYVLKNDSTNKQNSHRIKTKQSDFKELKIINQPTNIRRHKAKVANSSDSEEDTRYVLIHSNIMNSKQENSVSEIGFEKPNSSNLVSNSLHISTAHVSVLKAEEKTNNLNDMVDNTQKLIQQMKEEINSDINSIDGKNMSDSDPDSSSNTEQESSYSGTEDGTENITSDENEISSSENEDSPVIENVLNTLRTSSEDNEQFEEALDHLDNQIENFRHANIEILDSIAKTLQNEHTISVEIKEKKTENELKQDLNNNLFVAANSFEEIYDDLNVNDSIKQVNTLSEPNKSRNNENIFTAEPLQNIKILEKHDIHFSFFKMNAPIQVIHSENKHPVFKATLENIEEKPTDKNVIPKDAISPTPTVTTNIEEESEIVDNIPILDSNELQSDKAVLHTSRSVSPDEKNSKIIIQNENEPLQQSYVNNNIRASLSGGNSPELDITNSVQADQPSEVQNNKNKNEELPENTLSAQPQRNQKNNSATVRSNIPKLIKLAQNAKAKIDKNSPKLIVSKVPIRRTSLKQYPAPAPPKTNFGNIQNGHVKQLQTRLFSNKSTDSQGSKENESLELQPSTSTMHKKKLAPPPPILQTQKQPSPPKLLQPPEKKTNYFRETCRTEDEWTDSDSEDSQLQIVKPVEEATNTPPSPPPPITVRFVSGQLIDLAKVQLPEGSPERQARMLLAEGATETWEQAQLAVELIARGVDAPAALLAALECLDLSSALTYLNQDCELCASRLPEHEMVSMLRCTHRCCRECARHYFTVQITERSIADCVCPYCKVPELESLPEDAWLEYFAHLDILLKTLLETDVHELFQRKLRDRTLARDPNFRWCMECSSGFFVHPKQKKLRCPECKSVSCASCRKPWTSNHEGLTCEQYTEWLEDNDPERSVAAVQQHLRENGLECPRCHFKYSLSRGGCMHFTCTQCKYEFCYGCGKPFTMGARCGLSEYCARLGLHAHHPRNCLFYLRDKEPHDLQTLLQMNNVTYETEAAEGSTGRCPVQLQRETPTGLVDGTCGSEAPANFAGLCKGHYVEYLAGLARGLDPIPIMDVTELVAELRRRALPLPERGPWDTDPLYAGMCAEIVKEKIPLD